MWSFLRRQTLYFLVGFVVAFVIYLFIRFDADAVFLGVVIAAAAGLALSVFLWWLEGRFEERPARPPE
jgi:hypothetical protein